MTEQTTRQTTDQIRVRISLDAYDFAHPTEQQTQVYVQIPDVARVSYMLPGSRFEGLKDTPWPEVLDVAQEYYAQGWVIDPSTAVGRQAVMEWLRDPTNRDEMQVAYEEDQARQHPEMQKLRARVAELEAQRDRRRARLVALQNDALSMRGSLAPADGDRKVPFELGATLAPAVDWLIARVAELEKRLNTARTEAIADVGDWLDEHGQKDAAHLVYTCDIPAARDMKQAAEAGDAR